MIVRTCYAKINYVYKGESQIFKSHMYYRSVEEFFKANGGPDHYDRAWESDDLITAVAVKGEQS